MSDAKLVKKYGLKDGKKMLLLNPQGDILVRLQGKDVVDTAVSGSCDIVQFFAKDSSDIKTYFDTARDALKENGSFWIAYPKKSAKVETDLTRDEGWKDVYSAGLESVSMFSIDQTWSNIRFARALSEEEKIKAQYKGKKHLWPIYEQLVDVVHQIDPDVVFGIRKTYISLQKGKQFGIIQPSTKTRVDVGLKLPHIEATARLQPAGNFGSGQVTYKVAVTSATDIDDELVAWIKQAHDLLN